MTVMPGMTFVRVKKGSGTIASGLRQFWRKDLVATAMFGQIIAGPFFFTRSVPDPFFLVSWFS
jgi:hypothetical protein